PGTPDARRSPRDLGVLLRAGHARALGGRRADSGSGGRRIAASSCRARAPTPPTRGRTPMNDAVPVLAARTAGRRFGGHIAPEPTALELYDGEAVALVGPNGAG